MIRAVQAHTATCAMQRVSRRIVRAEEVSMVSRRPIAATLLLATAACSSVQPIAQPREFIATRQPQTVWVTTSEWTEPVPVIQPKVVGDTIGGTVYGEYMQVPLAQVSSVQAKQYSRK